CRSGFRPANSGGSRYRGVVMNRQPSLDLVVRDARPAELPRLGALVADAYAALPGMPGPGDQPAFYAMVRDAGARARNPAIHILAAVGPGDALVGSADFIEDVAH